MTIVNRTQHTKEIAKQAAKILRLYEESGVSIPMLCLRYDVKRPTIQRLLRQARLARGARY